MGDPEGVQELMETNGKKKYIGAAALLLIAVVAGIAVLTLKKPVAE